MLERVVKDVKYRGSGGGVIEVSGCYGGEEFGEGAFCSVGDGCSKILVCKWGSGTERREGGINYRGLRGGVAPRMIGGKPRSG